MEARELSYSFPLDEVEEALRAALAETGARVQRMPSPIYRSPWARHEVYLTDREAEGRHFIVSDMREMEGEDAEPGLLVGLYEDYETPEAEQPSLCETVQEATELVRRIALGFPG